MSTVLTGIMAKAYILGTGTRATWGAVDVTSNVHVAAAPTGLTEVDIIRSVDLNADDSEGDASRRASRWKLSVATQIDGSIDVEIPWAPADPNFVLIRNAKMTGKSVAMAFLDGDKATAGAQGLWADFVVFGFKKSEPIDKEQMVKITLKPTASAVPPEWVQIPLT